MEPEKKTPMFSDTLLITFLTVSGYLVLYLSKVGYFLYFKISISYIETNLFQLLIIFPFLVMLIVVLDSFHGFLLKKKIKIQPFGLLLYMFVNISIIGIWFIFFSLKWPEILNLMGTLFFFNLGLYLGRRYIKKGRGKLEALYKLNKIDKNKYLAELEKYQPVDSFFTSLIMKYPPLFVIVAMTFFTAVLSLESGAVYAKIRREFSIINTSPELVVLTNYSQRFICFEFDREKREIKNNYYIKTFEQISNDKIQIKIEKIGPLKPFKVKNDEIKEPALKDQTKGSDK